MAHSAMLSWLMVVFFVPELALLFYLLIGRQRLGKKRAEIHRDVVRDIRTDQRLAMLKPHIIRPDLDPALNPMVRQAEHVGGLPIVGANHVELLADTETVVAKLIDEIEHAQKHVHLLYYIFRPDETGRRVAEAMRRAAGRGVRVRLLVDAVSSRALFGRRGVAHALRAAGVQVVPALPVAPLRRGLARIDIRNHRKLAVIDGRVAFTGSQNIVNADYGHPRAGQWYDLTGRFTGPVVWQMQQVFLEDWTFETGAMPEDEQLFPHLEPTGEMVAQTVPTGPSDAARTFRRILLAAINAAQRKVIITSPYLIPDEPTLLGLIMAANRGVEVSLVVPRKTDHPLAAAASRASFADLLDAGVHIFQFKPGLLHAKTLTVDDAFGVLGSSNIDLRSFDINFELSVLLYGPEITAELRFAQTHSIDQSDPIDLNVWRRRPLLHRYAHSTAALFSPLL